MRAAQARAPGSGRRDVRQWYHRSRTKIWRAKRTRPSTTKTVRRKVRERCTESSIDRGQCRSGWSGRLLPIPTTQVCRNENKAKRDQADLAQGWNWFNSVTLSICSVISGVPGGVGWDMPRTCPRESQKSAGNEKNEDRIRYLRRARADSDLRDF